ncbi:MAG: hypothetical protein IT442_06720 [Phycisphaeraceae bacterium]|nr:hypothetical protein [Phycisphaeraceae bacterium]
MARNFKLRRFSNPSILRAISRPLLMEFLKSWLTHLAQRKLLLIDDDAFDYDGLAAVLMSPDENTPAEMLDALYFVDEMSLPCDYDELMSEARAADVDLGDGDELTPADLAVRIWLKDHDILERLHAQRTLSKPKSFECCVSRTAEMPVMRSPEPEIIHALEDDLKDWFDDKKRGRAAKVFTFPKPDGVWFLVRHGEPYKREGTLKGEEASSVYFRPEKFDVLAYNPELGELSIHAGSKGIKKTYCKLFGRHLFGDDLLFNVDPIAGKYTLDPIRQDGRACLTCSDVEGIEEVQLVELHFRHHSHISHVEVHKADDVFEALRGIGRSIPPHAVLVKAVFSVRFKGAMRPRKVTVRPPNVTIFDRESDAEVLHQWLTLRGFVLLKPVVSHEQADAVLAVH